MLLSALSFPHRISTNFFVCYLATEPPVPATTARPLITTRPPNVVTTNHPANVPTTRPLSKQTTRSLRRTTRKLTTQSPVPGTTSIKLLFNRQGSSGYGFSGEISMQNLGAQVVDGYTIQWRVKDGYDVGFLSWGRFASTILLF